MSMNITPTTPVRYTSSSATTASTVAAADKATTRQDTVELGSQRTENANTYTPPKKLDKEQVQAIREQLTAQQQTLLEQMAGNAIGQANSWLTSLGQQGRFPGLDLEGMKLPALATDPEGALAAISEGGAYSVDAVATRIFDMAKAMAGDDPAMMEKMKKAVQQGFKEAGLEFNKTMGQGLPDISYKTYDEVMKRFDEAATAGKSTV